jgi:hypothetical protein
LCDDSVVRSLLSHTCALTAREEPEPLFAVTLAALREAARADLEALPQWLAAQLAPKKPVVACALEVGWKFSDRVLHGADVPETLTDLDPVLDGLIVREPCSSSPAFVAKLRTASGTLNQINVARGMNVAGLVRSGNLDSVVSRAAPELTEKEPNAPGAAPVDELSRDGKVGMRCTEPCSGEAAPAACSRA